MTRQNQYQSVFLTLWLALYTALILSLGQHISHSKVLFDRYSLWFVLALALVALWAVGSAVLIGLLARLDDTAFTRCLGTLARLREHPTVRIAVIVLAGSALVVPWLRFPDILPDVPHPYLRFCGSIAILGAIYFGLFWRAADPPVRQRIWLLVGAIASFAALAVSIAYLDRFPKLDTLDELHNWVVQWTYARTGLLGDVLYRQMIPIPQAIYDSFHIPAALLMRLIGDGLWQARFARLLLTCLALPFIYNSGKILYGRRAGLMAVVIAFFLMAPTAYVRPDFGVGIMLSVGFYVYLKASARKKPLIRWLPAVRLVNYSPLLHFLTGLLIGLGGEGHPLAYRFGVAFAVIYLAAWINDMRVQRRVFIDGRIIALGMGGATAILIYIAIHILPTYQQSMHFATTYGPGVRTGDEQLRAALTILNQQSEIWLQYSPVEAWIFLVGLVFAILRGGRGDRLIVTILVVSEILMLVTYAYYRAFYQIHFLPLFALLMGKALADGFDLAEKVRPLSGQTSRLVLAGLVLLTCIAVLADTAANSTDPLRDEFEDVGAQLAATLPPSATIVGNEDYFLKFKSFNFYGISTVTTPTWFQTDLQGYELWLVTNPDIFILTSEIDWAKYVPSDSIRQYMNDFSFTLARCYTGSGLIHAMVYMKEVPKTWKNDSLDCQRWSAAADPSPDTAANR